MPGSVSATGKDTLQINGRNLADFADADYISIEFPEDMSSMKVSKNGNILEASNENGRRCGLTARLLAGSDDDKFLNSLFQMQKNDYAAFVDMTGVYAKRIGKGDGNVNSVVYSLAGGRFKKQLPAKTNAEGDVEQSAVVYVFQFVCDVRTIQ